MAIEIEASKFALNNSSNYGTNSILNIYYDETNNIGKLKLSENGLNVNKHENFVLGGIALLSNQDIGKIEDFRKLLRIQSNAPEVKFEMVAHGTFDKMLGSAKLSHALNWLLEKDIKIHYCNVNILNWFILEIIESIVAQDSFAHYQSMHRELKNELYHIATRDLASFLKLINNYSYPNIPKEKTKDFLVDLYQFILLNWPEHVFAPTEALKGIILQARTIPYLHFLVDNVPGELYSGTENFFLNRICTFKKSKHIFDNEKLIQEAIGDYALIDGSSTVSFEFVDSKKYFEIQLSDIVAGFLGKYFTFIEKTPTKTLINMKKRLTFAQKNNIAALRKLIEGSDKLSNALLHRITTIDSDNKSDYFLFDCALSPHLVLANR